MMNDDHNFKNLILDFSLEALRFLAPDEMRNLPPDVRVTPIRQEQTKERLGDRFYELDVALKLEFPDGTREAVVFCIEEDSRAEKSSWRRHAVYCLQLSELLDTTRVVPVVLYPFAKHPPNDACRLSTEQNVYLDFRCTVVTLGMMEAKEHAESGSLIERLCLPLMKQGIEEKWAFILKAFEGLATLEMDWDRRVKYFGFVTHYAELNPKQIEEFTEKYVSRSPQRENIMSMRDALLEMGVEKGKAIGKAEGKLEGKMEGKMEGSVEGQANLIATFFLGGVITREVARAALERLARHDDPNRIFVDAALKQIGNETKY